MQLVNFDIQISSSPKNLSLEDEQTGKKWVFPKIGVPQNGLFIMENPIKMDDLEVPLFLETPKWMTEFLQKIFLR